MGWIRCLAGARNWHRGRTTPPHHTVALPCRSPRLVILREPQRPKDLPVAGSRSPRASCAHRCPAVVAFLLGGPFFLQFFRFPAFFGLPFSRKFPEIALTMHFRLNTVCAFTHPAARGCRDRRRLSLPDSGPVSAPSAARKGLLLDPSARRAEHCRSLRRPSVWRAEHRRSLRRPSVWRAEHRRSLRRPSVWRAEHRRSLRRPSVWRAEHRRSLRRPSVRRVFHPTGTK
jgi:hypothetical protein